MTTHACKWPGCAAQIRAEHYACSAHWWKIPLAMRTRLNAAWRYYRGQLKVAGSSPTIAAGSAAVAEAIAEYRAADDAVQTWIRSQ